MIIIFGYKKLAEFLKVHVNTATRIAKSNLVYVNKYIISLKELNVEDLNFIILNRKQAKTTKIRPLFVYDLEKKNITS